MGAMAVASSILVAAAPPGSWIAGLVLVGVVLQLASAKVATSAIQYAFLKSMARGSYYQNGAAIVGASK